MALTREQLTKPLVVKQKIQETSDAYSYVFDIPSDLKERFKYQAGQFVTLFVDVSNEEVRRSYSLSSAPSQDTDFKITIKRVEGGKLSNYLIDHVNEGDKLHVTPPAGLFACPKTDVSKAILVAGGSGITPIISITKELLGSQQTQVKLIYANRNEDSIIFKNELDELKNKYGNRFDVIHALSQPSDNWSGIKGRVNESLISEIAKGFADNNTHYFVCGPQGLMDTVESTMKTLNVQKSCFHIESFNINTDNNAGNAPAADEIEVDAGALLIGDVTKKSAPDTITVTFNGETREVKYNGEDSILECLLKTDINPPYSCMDGACMACMAKVADGLVCQEEAGILTDENVEMRECLTCQAKPISAHTVIDYDDL